MTHYLRGAAGHLPHGAARRAGGGARGVGGRVAVAGGRQMAVAWRRASVRLAVGARAWLLARRGADRFVHGVADESVALDVAGCRRRARDAVAGAGRWSEAVRYVRSRVPAGEPIYVMTQRADLVTSGHPLLYVLADRPNPTRYDIAAPGVVTSAPVQREIVGDLERAGRPLVVRWVDPLTAAPEPNRAGRVERRALLDDYLAARVPRDAAVRRLRDAGAARREASPTCSRSTPSCRRRSSRRELREVRRQGDDPRVLALGPGRHARAGGGRLRPGLSAARAAPRARRARARQPGHGCATACRGRPTAGGCAAPRGSRRGSPRARRGRPPARPLRQRGRRHRGDPRRS